MFKTITQCIVLEFPDTFSQLQRKELEYIWEIKITLWEY